MRFHGKAGASRRVFSTCALKRIEHTGGFASPPRPDHHRQHPPAKIKMLPTMHDNSRFASGLPRRIVFGAAMSVGLFWSATFCAGAAPDSGPTPFQKLTEDYFSEQTLQFSRELLLKEE